MCLKIVCYTNNKYQNVWLLFGEARGHGSFDTLCLSIVNNQLYVNQVHYYFFFLSTYVNSF